MTSTKTLLLIAAASSLISIGTAFPAETQNTLPAGSRVFIAPMGGFETYLKEAMDKKKVSIQIVDNDDQADFEVSGAAETQKASTAKKVIMWDWRSNEQASIQVTNLKTKEVIFAYSVNKPSSTHGRRSSAEACAKHLKDRIEAK